jgi:membrane-bound lytic murein transglycosylase A
LVARLVTFAVCAFVALLTCAPGCRQPAPSAQATLDYSHELPDGELALRKLLPSEYPDFTSMQTDPAALARAIDNSLLYLSHPSSQRYFPYLDITHERAVATLKELRRLAGDPAVRWNDEIRARFDVYQSIGAPAANGPGYSGEVLFTGYFTPIYDASLVRTGPYQWPLYKRPADLVTDETGEQASRRLMTPGQPSKPAAPGAPEMVPLAANTYWTREEIERDGKLRGQELVWLKSRWEAYVVTVQGSARLRLTDGRIYEIGFAGSNGHAYPGRGAAPADRMLADGVITRAERTLQGMGRYFAEHPEAMDRYLWANPRTVFFTERRGGPFGKLNVPVTAFATIATDKQVYPRAMPAYGVTSVARSADAGASPYRGFMLDQDAGGAIRSAGRCDIYMGVGPQAEQLSGRQAMPGQLYYLAIRL